MEGVERREADNKLVGVTTRVLFDSGNARARLFRAINEEIEERSEDAERIIEQARESDKLSASSRARSHKDATSLVTNIPEGYEDLEAQTVVDLTGNDSFRNKAGQIGTVEKIEADSQGVIYVSVRYPGGIISRFPETLIGKTHIRIRKIE